MEQTFYIKANSVAFTGHRSVPESKKDELKKKLRGKIRLLYAMGIRNYYCGMAIGFDMLAAEVVLSLRSELPYLSLSLLFRSRSSQRDGIIRSKQGIRDYFLNVMILLC